MEASKYGLPLTTLQTSHDDNDAIEKQLGTLHEKSKGVETSEPNESKGSTQSKASIASEKKHRDEEKSCLMM